MKFRYSQYAVVPTPAAPDRTVLYRPVIPVRFVGPDAALDVYALLDTGADESYVTQSVAARLGIVPVSDDVSTIQSASGAMSVIYGRLTIEVADDDGILSIPATVGIVGEDWSESILGHIGFLEHFDATFSYAERLVTLTQRRE